MNTDKRFVTMKGFLRVLALCAFALMFALPFVIKSLDVPKVVLCFITIFGWCGISFLFVMIWKFENTLKGVLESLFCFFFAFYFFVYSWFISLYPLDFAGLGKWESIGVILIPITLIPLIHSVIMIFGVFLGYLAAKRTNNSILRAVIISFGYVVGEYLQSVGTFAFPWTRLFVGQTAFPSLLQSASLFGSYFITFIMVLVNALIALFFINSKENKKRSVACLCLALTVFTVNLGYGLVRINLSDNSELKKIDALVLQGNIPSGVKWSGEVDEKEIYLDLAEYARKK